jgi:hypothetical protein
MAKANGSSRSGCQYLKLLPRFSSKMYCLQAIDKKKVIECVLVEMAKANGSSISVKREAYFPRDYCLI